ncbi:MAG TPA: phosphonate C-P lyase system protein PhnH [Rhodospirillales bacterium]|nr:phosphonate C-P lyase system protein PhnH [Rhodospirillales bacterium]
MMRIEKIWRPTTQQGIFRSVMEAISRPGISRNIDGLINGCGAHRGVLAMFLDAEVSLADPQGLLNDDDWPLFQAQRSSADKADYILCGGRDIVDFDPRLGTLSCPDQSATLVICVDHLNEGSLELRFQGPGVDGSEEITVSGLHHSWLDRRTEWVAQFPLGADILLVDSKHVLGMPRTTRVEVL